MTEHYCIEHKTMFFKTPKMRAYSHPVKDEAGVDVLNEETGKQLWCKEEDQESYHDPNPAAQTTTIPAPSQPKEVSGVMSKEDWSDKDTRTRKSIERQKSLAEATNWCIAQLQAGKEIKTVELLSVAKLFELYLDGGSVVVVEKKK